MKNSNNKFKKRLMKLSVIALLGLAIPLTSIANANNETRPKDNNDSDQTLETTGGLEIDVLHQGSQPEVEYVDKVSQEPTIFSTFAAPSGGPHFGDFIGGTGKTINIYSSSTSSNALTSIEPAPRSSGVVPILDQSGNRYKIALAGLIGWIDKPNIRLAPFAGVKGNDYYYVNDSGELIHGISTQGSTSNAYSFLNQGKAPSYLKKGTRYLSYDGKHFYFDSVSGLNALIKDYNSSPTNRPNSVNPKTPFYNYFQYLPVRTQSNLSIKDMRDYFTRDGQMGTTRLRSSLFDTEKDFINMGNFFGNNYSLGFATAIHESGSGNSYYSHARNNFFGHNAVDSDPNQANGYLTPALGLYVHFGDFINWSYSNINYTYYNGGFVGNKKIGMNVKYASDPYWGEKIAAHYYNMDKKAGGKDYDLYTLGRIKNNKSKVYKNASISSGVSYEQRADTMIAITNTITQNGKTWYQFSAESMLDSNKNILRWINKDKSLPLPYVIKNSQVFIEAENVEIVHRGKGTGVLAQTQIPIKKSPKLETTKYTIKTTRNTELRGDWSNYYSPTYVIPKGSEIKDARFTDNGWVYVLYYYAPYNMDYVGFIKASDVEKIGNIKPPALPQPGNIKYKVTAAKGLNLRTAPINGSVVTTIPNNTIVTGGTPLNGWVHVNYNGRVGYVSEDFLETGGSENPPTSNKFVTKDVAMIRNYLVDPVKHPLDSKQLVKYNVYIDSDPTKKNDVNTKDIAKIRRMLLGN